MTHKLGTPSGYGYITYNKRDARILKGKVESALAREDLYIRTRMQFERALRVLEIWVESPAKNPCFSATFLHERIKMETIEKYAS